MSASYGGDRPGGEEGGASDNGGVPDDALAVLRPCGRGSEMGPSVATRVLAALLAVSMTGLGCVRSASAGVVTTQHFLELAARPAPETRLKEWLASEAVQERLVTLGVAPAVVDARLAAMTAEERALLAERIDELPAGGDVLALIGAVFIVLLILEIVGVVDIFKKA
jgi:hypothetical protein